LGVAIATAHFSPLAAVPSAIFSVWHNLSGSVLANLYSRMKDKNEPVQSIKPDMQPVNKGV
jgi:BASS family bile acid:Na+ symporter